jgi:hypothetical protein
MLHKLITKKLIYFNLTIIISLFFISFFFKPNLTTKIDYKFNDISINQKLLIFNEIIGKTIVSEKFIDNITTTKLDAFIYRYLQYLTDTKNESVYKNCPTEITKGYFRDVRIYEISRFNDSFSVEINYDSLSKSAEEEIKKCFQVIFIEQLNKYYFENLEMVKNITSNLIETNKLQYQSLKSASDLNKYKLEERIISINYMNDIKYFISPQSENKPIITKKSISYLMLYLIIIFLFFIIQIFYIFRKSLNYKKVLK